MNNQSLQKPVPPPSRIINEWSGETKDSKKARHEWYLQIDTAGDRTPRIDLDHTDGPMLVTSDSTVHWITLYERFCLWIGIDTTETLHEKYTQKETKCNSHR